MRNVLKNNSEVAHFWANKIQDSGRAGNMFFRSGCIYSYGEHFMIARHITNKKGESAALFNPRSYSISTAKHQGYTRSAASHLKTFTVPEIRVSNKLAHKFNLAYYKEQLNDMRLKFTRARTYKESYKTQIGKTCAEAIAYVEFFDLGKKEISIFEKLGSFTDKDIEALKKQNAEISAKNRAQNEARRAAQREREAKTRAALDRWARGAEGAARSYSFNNLPVRLRISKDKKRVETSRGAEVGILSARALLVAIRRGADVVGREINGFRVNAYDKEILTIGCHKIPLMEIERIALEIEGKEAKI